MGRLDTMPSALGLLVMINLKQSWRRLKAVRAQSRLLTALILAFVTGYLGLAFYLFYRGLKFVGGFPGLGALLVERLLFLLFAFLFVLLIFSNLVITYTNLFRNREAAFLLTAPVEPQVVYQWKFMEAMVLASWAFLFLVAPLLAAFGMNRGVAWHFYPAMVAYLGVFIIIPGVAGAFIAVLVARYLERRVFQLLILGGAAILLCGMACWLHPEPMGLDGADQRVQVMLDQLLTRTHFAEQVFLPSFWLSHGIIDWAEGALTSASFFGLVLLSHGLFWGFLSFTQTGSQFYEAASAVQSRSAVFGQWSWFQAWRTRQKTRVWRRSLLEMIVDWLPVLSLDARAMVLKDIRVFWRDTTQWGQTIVLFGLLGVYIINLRHFSSQLTNPFWVHLVSYLNLVACALNLSTLTTRFVFPQFSLEGKRVWIIGMSPLGLFQVIRVKFWLWSGASMIITGGLVFMSCHMLKMPWEKTAYFLAIMVVMTLTLNGMAIGLGTLYPNLKEDHPGKIVSGFGGTFCLVLSFVYVVAAVVILALISPWNTHWSAVSPWMHGLGTLLFLLISTSLGGMPIYLAHKKLQQFEY